MKTNTLIVFCILNVIAVLSCQNAKVSDEILSEDELVGSLGGLKGEYFNDRSEQPVLVRVDPVVNFLFGEALPDPLVTEEFFSARWTGRLIPVETAEYTLIIRSGDSFRSSNAADDDGRGDSVRLFINDNQIIGRTYSYGVEQRATISLEAGVEYAIRLEYTKRQRNASIRLLWSNRLGSQVVASKFLLPPTNIPSPFIDTDVGLLDGRRIGFAEVGDGGVFSARGSGTSIGGSRDSFYFVAQPTEADTEVSARVLPLRYGVTGGIMIRENVSASARHVFVGVQQGRYGPQLTVVSRSEAGEFSSTSRFDQLRSTAMVKLKRKGDTFEIFAAPDGAAFKFIKRVQVQMADRVFSGLALTSSGTREAAQVFDQVQVNRNYRFLARDGVASEASSNEYYAAIGAVQGLTLEQWEAQRMVGPVVRVIFRNEWDLGFWREMNCTESLARGQGGCWVRNWANEEDIEDPDAANLGTVAMDVSPEGFTRFFVFGPDGVLSAKAALDAEGAKFAPELCTTCHSGRYTPPGGSPDLGSVFREFEPSLLKLRAGLESRGSEGRSIAEKEFAALNRAIRSANIALRSQAEGGALGVDRARSGVNDHLNVIYRDTPEALKDTSSIPRSSDVRDANPEHMPASWATDADPELQAAKRDVWAAVVNPYCMNCHRTNSVDLSIYPLFDSLSTPINVTPGDPRGERSLFKHMLRGTTYTLPNGIRAVMPVMPQSEQMMRNLGLVEAARDDVRGPLRGNRFGELEAIDAWLSHSQRVRGLPQNLR